MGRVFDKASHQRDSLPGDLYAQAFLYGGMYLGWLATRSLCSKSLRRKWADEISALASGTLSGPEMYRQMGGVLEASMMTAEAARFSDIYFAGEDAHYPEDFAKHVAGGALDLMRARDTPRRFAALGRRIDARLADWRARRAAPPRPEGVPRTAVWCPDEDGLGRFRHARQRDGKDHGRVRFWRADGSLVCVAHYHDGDVHGSLSRWHPDGQLSQQGVMFQGRPVGRFSWFPPREPSDEALPSGITRLHPAVARIEYDFGEAGFRRTLDLGYELFDARGRAIDARGRRVRAERPRPPNGPLRTQALSGAMDPRGEGFVLHDTGFDDPEIIIGLSPPAPERSCWLLYTLGMSDQPMRVTPGHAASPYAELSLALPSDWKLDDRSLETERWSWPIHWLRYLARMPFAADVALFEDVIVGNGHPPTKLARGTDLAGALLRRPSLTSRRRQRLPGGKSVAWLEVWAVTADEARFGFRRGAAVLRSRLEADGVTAVLDPQRASLV